MKSILQFSPLLTLILMLVPGHTQARRGNYAYLYNNCKQIGIEAVRQTDIGTRISFCYKDVPHARFALASTLIANDEQGGHHRAIEVEGIQLDSICMLPDDGIARFTITFDALPADTRFFDIIESGLPSGALHIYGIHKKSEQLKFGVFSEELKHEEFNPEFFNPGPVYIRGKIHGYSHEHMNHVLRFPRFSETIFAVSAARFKGECKINLNAIFSDLIFSESSFASSRPFSVSGTSVRPQIL